MRPPAPRFVRVSPLVAAALLVAGCGSVLPGSAAPSAAPAPSDGSAATTADGSGATSAGASPIDCTFLSAPEVAALIGSSPEGRASGTGCTWEDQQTYKSVTIEVDQPGTAANGTLPEWDPAFGPERTLPGGMRDINGAVQFVCGGTRLCQVQVATAEDSAGDRAKALALVAKVKAKVG